MRLLPNFQSSLVCLGIVTIIGALTDERVKSCLLHLACEAHTDSCDNVGEFLSILVISSVRVCA